MLTIRETQWRVLADVALEEAAADRLSALFPQHAALLGPQGLRDFLRDSRRRARAYRLGDAQVEAFAALELTFGPGFAEHPDFGWAKAILEDPHLRAPELRMESLRNAGVSWLQALPEAP